MSDDDVLVVARGFADRIADAEIGLISAAFEWAHRNPGQFLAAHEKQWYDPALAYRAEWEDVAEDACILVNEYSIPAFAYATGQSEQVARSLIRDAVVMFYRFPRTWARMTAGQVPVWRARLVPRYGRCASDKVVAYLDRHINSPGQRITRPQVQRLLDEARLRFLPEEVAAETEAAAEDRRAEVDLSSVAHLGLGELDACLELADAMDLEAAISHGAAALKKAGSTDPLNVRRAHALGDLARSAQRPSATPPTGDRPRWDGTGVPKTGVKLYIHLNHTAFRCVCTPGDDGRPTFSAPPGTRNGSVVEYMIRGPGPPPGPGITPDFLLPDDDRDDDHLGEASRVDGTGVPTLVLDPEVIKRWFTRPSVTDPRAGPKITIRQVVDPQDYDFVDAYEVPERVKDAIAASGSRTCVFPYCHASALRADCDHTVPYAEGGPTCPCNLAPLCRRHHRLKTHGQHNDDHRWTYATLGNDSYVWQGPNSIHLLRSPSGTHVLPGDIFTHRPADGAPTAGVRLPDGRLTHRPGDDEAFEVLSDRGAVPGVDEHGAPVPMSGSGLRQRLIRHQERTAAEVAFLEQHGGREDDLMQPIIDRLWIRPKYAPRMPRRRTAGMKISELMAHRLEQNRHIRRRMPFPTEELRGPHEIDNSGPPPF